MDSPPTLHPAPARCSVVPPNLPDLRAFAVPYMAVVILVWLFVATTTLVYVFGPTNVWIGPNTSINVELSPVFFQSVKVEELDGSETGLQLFGFNASPPVDVVNWSESRLVSVSHKSYKEWPYYLNGGSSLNISYNVKTEGYSVWLVVKKGMATDWLLEEPPFEKTALSLNQIQGSGMIQVNISNSEGYHLAVVNPNLNKDVEVELDIDVRAVVYDTKEPFYKCNFSNRECIFNTMPLDETSLVLTSSAPRQGVLAEEQKWFIRISYQARWISYAIVTGIFICLMLLALKNIEEIERAAGERYVLENDSPTTSLLVNKDDDGSRVCSSTESLAAYDDDQRDCGTRFRCAICFDAQRDCFFLPCGHCVSCYQCGTEIAKAVGRCPICRKKTEKVNLIYTV